MDRWRGEWTHMCGFWRPKTVITVHPRRYHRNRAEITPPRRLARKEVMSIHRRPRASSVPPITDRRRTSVLACIYYYYYYFHGFFIIAMLITGGCLPFRRRRPITQRTRRWRHSSQLPPPPRRSLIIIDIISENNYYLLEIPRDDNGDIITSQTVVRLVITDNVIETTATPRRVSVTGGVGDDDGWTWPVAADWKSERFR